jgi:CheY-like chemotaxis protein
LARSPINAPRILVVDDEVYNRDLMVRTFARSGEVVAAADAAEAIAVLERWGAHVLVTDLALGSPSGIDLATEVRARWPAVRIVVVTGFDLEPALLQARAGGVVDDVIAKPWQPAALRARVLSLISQAEQPV